MKDLKRDVYIGLWMILGALLQFILLAMLYIFYIQLLLENFDHWGFGFSWNFWFLTGHLFAILFFIAGIMFGYRRGIYWWDRLYKYGKLRHPVKIF